MSSVPRLAPVPDPNVMFGSPRSGLPIAATVSRSFMWRVLKHLRGVLDRMIASSSLVTNDPVLDVRGFGWTAGLRENWAAIRDEAVQVALQGTASQSPATIVPADRAIADVDAWRSFVLYGYGCPVEQSLARCPRTAAAVARIPGLDSAFFSILAPGTHIPEHRGVSKGLITCHLGLIVPRDGDVRMRIQDRVVRWAEGETLVFDDTYQHEVWNDTTGTRVVLSIQFERPLRNPGKWIADMFLNLVRRAAFVQDAAATSAAGPPL